MNNFRPFSASPASMALAETGIAPFLDADAQPDNTTAKSNTIKRIVLPFDLPFLLVMGSSLLMKGTKHGTASPIKSFELFYLYVKK
jgi:hypothetical protein